uniref:ATPase subunit 8 n=1 Tax=Ectatops sp. TaxID=2931290 RepID=A0A8T9ZXG2_9HEMI|nr:ATPase subunit 8 [Ectatops sp.]
MPQMAPLWWEYLYLMNSLLMIIISTLIYHNKMNYPIKQTLKYKKLIKNWKW